MSMSDSFMRYCVVIIEEFSDSFLSASEDRSSDAHGIRIPRYICMNICRKLKGCLSPLSALPISSPALRMELSAKVSFCVFFVESNSSTKMILSFRNSSEMNDLAFPSYSRPISSLLNDISSTFLLGMVRSGYRSRTQGLPSSATSVNDTNVL